MTLNVAPEGIFDVIIGLSMNVILIIALFKIKSAQVITLKLIVLGWICGGFVFFFDGISILLLNVVTAVITNLLQYYTIILWLLALNFNSKENYYSFSLLGIIAFGVLLHIAAFAPGSITIQMEDGFLATASTGLFDVLVNISYVIWAVLAFTMGVRTLIYSPYEIKKDAWIFMIGILIGIGGGISIYFLVYWSHLMIYPSDIFSFVTSLLWTYCILKTPKLFYILPFSVYRLTIKDKAGNVLYNYDWSKLKIKNVLLTKYLDTIQAVSDRLIKVGGVVDINFSAGIIIINEGKYTTAALFASKASKILRQALITFSSDFEQTFEKELQAKSAETEKYDPAYALIEKFFSNFPSRMITGKNQRIFVSRSFKNMPLTTKDKLKAIFTNSAEYEMVMSEMDKTPKCVPNDFLKLYDEMKNEIESDDGEKAEPESNDKANITSKQQK